MKMFVISTVMLFSLSITPLGLSGQTTRYDQALELLKAGQHGDVINMLESEVRAGKSSAEGYKIYASAQLADFGSMTGAFKLLSKLFGDKLNYAKNALEKAGKLDSKDIEVKFLMAIYNKYSNKMDLAESQLREIIEVDPRFEIAGFSNAWLELGSVLRAQEKNKDAIEAYQQGALVDLEDRWPLIQISNVYLEIGEFELACEAFYAGLDNIVDQDKVDRLFLDVEALATVEEKEEWKKLKSNTEKTAFLKVFWKRRDPNPIDMINQRYIEHYKRLKHVKEFYSKSFKPWYDDRGQVYVRLGKPDNVYYGMSEQGIKTTESWVYDRYRGGINLDFVQFGSGYELRSLFEAIEPTARMNDIVNMFERRSNLHPYYTKMANKIKTEWQINRDRAMTEFEESTSANQGNVNAVDRLGRTNWSPTFMSQNEFLQDQQFNNSYAQNQHFVFDVGAPHLPMNCNFSGFRGEGDKTRLDFYYMIPFKQMSFAPDGIQLDKFVSKLTLHYKVFDMDYQEIESYDRTYPIQASVNQLESHSFIDEIRTDLESGKYVVAIEAVNNTKDKVGIYQFVINVRNYKTDTLVVSDVQLAQYVERTVSSDKFLKPSSNYKVVPNPAASQIKTKPLTLYYEIYNLTLDNDGKSKYEVSYTIRMSKEDKGIFSSIAGIFSSGKDPSTTSVTVKEGRATTQRDYIAFDVSELPNGIATLEIKVKDLNSNRYSRSSIDLTIVEEKNLEAKKQEKVSIGQ